MNPAPSCLGSSTTCISRDRLGVVDAPVDLINLVFKLNLAFVSFELPLRKWPTAQFSEISAMLRELHFGDQVGVVFVGLRGSRPAAMTG